MLLQVLSLREFLKAYSTLKVFDVHVCCHKMPLETILGLKYFIAALVSASDKIFEVSSVKPSHLLLREHILKFLVSKLYTISLGKIALILINL